MDMSNRGREIEEQGEKVRLQHIAWAKTFNRERRKRMIFKLIYAAIGVLTLAVCWWGYRNMR